MDKKWIEDPSQPVGAAGNVAVDPAGNPAFAGHKKPHHLFYKKNGVWIELEVCSIGVTFGSDGTLYRRGCDEKIYKYSESEWTKLSDKEAINVAAGTNSVWIIDH